MLTEFLPGGLMLLSAAIIFSLGGLHLLLTYRGLALTPSDSECQKRMHAISPRISAQTTMWRAWLGFNASHSAGAMFFGLVYGYLAIANVDVLFESLFLLTVGLAILIGWLVLAWMYWFRVPLLGIAAALVCYICALAFA